MKHFETNLSLKVAKNHHCELCHYNTSKFTDYKKHLQTIKHKNRENETLVTDLSLKVAKHLQCICGMSFNNRTTLWRHKKICNGSTTPSNIITTDYVMELIKDNKEMKQIILEQNNTINNLVKNGVVTNNNNNITHTNSHNKSFNLNFFLNETCKDAINMSDFVNQIQVSLSDLEETGRIGYAEGISKLIIKNLNNIDSSDRPIHCNDLKRETIYIKENDQWTKDDDKKSGLTKVIKQVAHKNIKKIIDWQKLYPDFSDPDSKHNDKYMNIVLNSMAGSTDEEQKNNINKIIRNVTKEVVIEK